MKASLRWALMAAAALLAGAANAVVFATAPDARGDRIAIDCESLPAWECKLQVQGDKASPNVTTMRFDQPSWSVDLLREAAADSSRGASVPDASVLARIHWSGCRSDKKFSGLVDLCPVAGDEATRVLFLRALCDKCKYAPFIVTKAGAPATLKPESSPPAPPLATTLQPQAALSASGQLRIDGVYATEDSTAAGARTYLRFFEGGEVLHVNFVGPPERLCQRYGKGTNAAPGLMTGRVEQVGADVAVAVAFNASTARFKGRVDRERLRLERVDHNGFPLGGGHEFDFYECPAVAVG